MSQEEEKLTDHAYDGILEYDNPMPSWWKNLFWGSIFFSIAYTGYYHLGDGKLAHAEYAAEMAEWEAQQKALAAKNAPRPVTEAELGGMMADAAAIGAGHAKFTAVCSPCHGERGEGKIGPNLTDGRWIHGDGSLTAIHKVVTEGVLAKGMPPWERAMKPEELRQVVAFVGSIRNTNVPGKAPEGNELSPVGTASVTQAAPIEAGSLAAGPRP